MRNHIVAELLKNKRGPLLKISLIIPIVVSFIALGFNHLGGPEAIKYDVETIVNHWVLIWLPLQITLLSGMLNEFEKKNTHYKLIFPMNINLCKKEFSRSIVVLLFLIISSVFLSLILIVTNLIVVSSPHNVSLVDCIIAVFMCLLVLLWQIPLWLWISRRTNMYFCIILNVLLSLELGTRFAMTSTWFFVPWSWALRTQMFFTGLYSNGLPIPSEKTITNLYEVLLAACFAIIMYIVFTFIDNKSFKKMEVK